MALWERLFAHTPPHLAAYVNAVSIVIAFAVITYFEVLLGELVPKSLALQRSERIALAVAGPMDVFIRMTRPAVRLMNGSATLVLRLFKVPLSGETESHSPDELKLIATATRRMGFAAVVPGRDDSSRNRVVARGGARDYDAARKDLCAAGEPDA